ncbi:MAG: alpha-glucosidase [Micavibrio sp.]|nr:alpha-glucosidase [Micavibrio sp.]|tara:strand:- start:489 stop:2135 length:1647 start_codon:yes stop_codon:yes gene_type:complete
MPPENSLENSPEHNWWRGAVFYQVYPRSFMDTSGNGVGDLPGITQNLGYIADLGVDALWISPFLKSPQKDYGYDVSDYYQVDPLFGSLDDYRNLLDAAHRLKLKVIMDMVLSHTSDQHEWFRQSKQNRTNPKADWYVWADPKPDGSPPNNWLSIFGGPAWRFHPGRGQYYLHNFLKEQPDLNYHNKDVRQAMLDTCRFWLDFGVDGFRLDAVNFCTHNRGLHDNPPRSDGGSSSQLDFPEAYNMQWHIHDKTQPENLSFMRQIRALLDDYDNRFALAEIGDDNAVQTSAHYTADDDLLHTAYSFDLMGHKGAMPGNRFFIQTLTNQMAEPGQSWPSWAFSNHDVVRAPSRWSGTEYGHSPALSRLLPVLLCSLRGTAFLYQGDELGLPEAAITPDQICDPWGRYLWPLWQGRDGCRTPMPWNNESPHAGFSTAQETWLPIPSTHRGLTVATQEKDKTSTLHAVRNFLHWRKRQGALKDGDIEFLDTAPDILCFKRSKKGQDTIICAFNLSAELQDVPSHGALAYASDGANENGESVRLPAYGFVFFKP